MIQNNRCTFTQEKTSMPFVHRDTIQPLKKNPFIGRAEEIQFFKQCILEPESPTHNIISIHGPGGVGKSTFLSQLVILKLL